MRFSRAFALLSFVASVVLAGCSGKDDEPMVGGPCGNVVCTMNQVCDRESSSPVCKCHEAYTGSSCTQCARGYIIRDGKCERSPMDCDTQLGLCGARGSCLKTEYGVSYCVCETGYSGDACQTCADGYQDNNRDGTCVPTCKTSGKTCTLPHVCLDTSGTPTCGCPPGTSGPTCSACAAGAVMQPDGSCKVCAPNSLPPLCETCASGYMRVGEACVACPANTTGTNCESCRVGYVRVSGMCVTCPPNSTGTNCETCNAGYMRVGGSCVACPANTTGANCESCAAGYTRTADGRCIQTCASIGSCPVRRVCDDTSGTAMCVCQAGFTGADCSQCAAGYVSDGAGRCVMIQVPAGTTLIGTGVYQGTTQLLAINPTAGTATPLRPVPTTASITQLAADGATRTIWAATSNNVSRLDLATGTLTPVATVTSTQSLTFGAGALYTVPTLSPYLLKRIDPTTGAVADLGPTMIASTQGLAWEATGKLLLARPRSSAPAWGPELHRLDAMTGAATPVGTPAFGDGRLRPSDPRVALALEPKTGKPFVVTRVGRTPAEIMLDHCQKMAAGLGLTGYDMAPMRTFDAPYAGIGAGMTKVITASGTGPEIAAYASYGGSTTARGILRIETTNPQAFVCVSTYTEAVELRIAATARFAGIAYAGYRPNLTLTVESGFPPTTKPTLHVYGQVQTYLDQSVRAYAVSKVYTSTEWSQLKLPYYVSLWDSDPSAPARLIELDPTTWAPVKMQTFPNVDLQPLLAPWQ